MVRVKGERTICAALKLYSRVKMVEEHRGTRPVTAQDVFISDSKLSYSLSQTVCKPCERKRNQVCAVRQHANPAFGTELTLTYHR